MRIDFTRGREQISPEPTDTRTICIAAIKAVELVISDSEDYGPQRAWAIFNTMTNDERREFQFILKSTNPNGTRKSYYSCFVDHLKLEKEWIRNQ